MSIKVHVNDFKKLNFMHLTAGTVEGGRYGDHGFDKTVEAQRQRQCAPSAPSPPHTAVPARVGGGAYGAGQRAASPGRRQRYG